MIDTKTNQVIHITKLIHKKPYAYAHNIKPKEVSTNTEIITFKNWIDFNLFSATWFYTISLVFFLMYLKLK